MRDARDSREGTTRLNGDLLPRSRGQSVAAESDVDWCATYFRVQNLRNVVRGDISGKVKREIKREDGQVRARGPRVRGSFENTDATDEVLSRTRFCRVLRVARGRAIERTFAPANQRHRRARRDQSTAAPTASFQRRGSAPRRLKLRSAWNPLTAFLIFRLKKDKEKVRVLFSFPGCITVSRIFLKQIDKHATAILISN